jgi:8-oxo-dGTP pyrophosphatase MutT (NUDIX family)
MSPEEIEKIQNDLIDEFNAEYDRKWTEVKSSAIRAVSFDEANGKLEVMMKNFKVYSFMQVSKTDFDEFLLSQSKGKWLVNFIAKRKQSKNQKTATVKWGTAGSGVLYYCQEDQTILLLKRSLDVLDPNMWGIPGGAVKGTEGFVDNLEKAPDFDEETLRSSADKEVEEEIGHLPDGPTLIKSVTIQFGSFKYTTFLMGVTLEQKNNITTNSQLNWESTKLEWFNLTNLPKNLHPGVKSAIEKLF